MAELISQREEDDCTVCCLAMATGMPYERMREVAEATRFGYTPGKGTVSPIGILRELGVEAVSDNRLLFEIGHSELAWKVMVRMLWGRRAIVSLPSQNGWKGHHDVYWDGAQVLDPTNKVAYPPDALKGVQPVGIVILQEVR